MYLPAICYRFFLVARNDDGRGGIVKNKNVDDDDDESLFLKENELVYLSPCDDFSQGFLPEWFQLCVCHRVERVHCKKERLVYKKGYEYMICSNVETTMLNLL